MQLRWAHTKFHKDWFRHSKVIGGGGGVHRNTGRLEEIMLKTIKEKE
jgi:hypothetical protein